MTPIETTSPKILKDLFCFCGKPAERCTASQLPARGPKKMSKTNSSSEEPQTRDLQPYGWSCREHVPSL